MKKVHDNVHKRYSDKTMLTIKTNLLKIEQAPVNKGTFIRVRCKDVCQQDNREVRPIKRRRRQRDIRNVGQADWKLSSPDIIDRRINGMVRV